MIHAFRHGARRAMLAATASVIALTGDDARKIGLSWDASEVETVAG